MILLAFGMHMATHARLERYITGARTVESRTPRFCCKPRTVSRRTLHMLTLRSTRFRTCWVVIITGGRLLPASGHVPHFTLMIGGPWDNGERQRGRVISSGEDGHARS